MNTEQEIWKTCIGWDGYYEVSDIGRVRSLPRFSRRELRFIKPALNSKGYPQFVGCRDGTNTSIRVHRLVAMAFIANPQNHPTVNHKNGIKNDNRVENLEWVTEKENQAHSYRELNRVGSAAKFERHQVEKIRELYRTKAMNQQQLADLYGVHNSSICLIVNRKAYRNISAAAPSRAA